MTHRLLPSIVFASGSLLACGGQVDAALPDVSTPLPDVDATNVDVGRPPDTVDSAPPEAAPPELDAGIDARLCEPGWHTTKGQICVTDGGLECCRRLGDEDAGDAGEQCCPVPK